MAKKKIKKKEQVSSNLMDHGVLEEWKLTKIIPREDNPRELSTEGLDNLHKSFETFGELLPIVVNRNTGNIVSGHQRYEAKKERGEKKTLVYVVELTEAQEDAALITLNEHSGMYNHDSLSDIVVNHMEGITAEAVLADRDALNEFREELLTPKSTRVALGAGAKPAECYTVLFPNQDDAKVWRLFYAECRVIAKSEDKEVMAVALEKMENHLGI